jgi:hypothetical protein
MFCGRNGLVELRDFLIVQIYRNLRTLFVFPSGFPKSFAVFFPYGFLIDQQSIMIIKSKYTIHFLENTLESQKNNSNSNRDISGSRNCPFSVYLWLYLQHNRQRKQATMSAERVIILSGSELKSINIGIYIDVAATINCSNINWGSPNHLR